MTRASRETCKMSLCRMPSAFILYKTNSESKFCRHLKLLGFTWQACPNSADIEHYYLWCGSTTWFSAVMSNLLNFCGSLKVKLAVITLWLSFCGRKNKESADIGKSRIVYGRFLPRSFNRRLMTAENKSCLPQMSHRRLMTAGIKLCLPQTLHHRPMTAGIKNSNSKGSHINLTNIITNPNIRDNRLIRKKSCVILIMYNLKARWFLWTFYIKKQLWLVTKWRH